MNYLFDPSSILRACFYIKHSTKFLEILLNYFCIHLSLILKVCFGAHQKKDHLLMTVFSNLLEPRIKTFKGGPVVNGKGQEDPCDALIECSDDCFECLLAGLGDEISTVSQICIFTYFLASMATFFVAN